MIFCLDMLRPPCFLFGPALAPGRLGLACMATLATDASTAHTLCKTLRGLCVQFLENVFFRAQLKRGTSDKCMS